MTETELATSARLVLDSIVIVFNNADYSTEKFIPEGPLNDISNWYFHRLGELCGPAQSFNAPTEEMFERALMSALVLRTEPSIINVILRPDDISLALRRLSDRVKTGVKGK